MLFPQPKVVHPPSAHLTPSLQLRVSAELPLQEAFPDTWQGASLGLPRNPGSLLLSFPLLP